VWFATTQARLLESGLDKSRTRRITRARAESDRAFPAGCQTSIEKHLRPNFIYIYIYIHTHMYLFLTDLKFFYRGNEKSSIDRYTILSIARHRAHARRSFRKFVTRRSIRDSCHRIRYRYDHIDRTGSKKETVRIARDSANFITKRLLVSLMRKYDAPVRSSHVESSRSWDPGILGSEYRASTVIDRSPIRTNAPRPVNYDIPIMTLPPSGLPRALPRASETLRTKTNQSGSKESLSSELITGLIFVIFWPENRLPRRPKSCRGMTDGG